MKKSLLISIALFASLTSVAQADPAAGIEASRDFCIEQEGGTNPGTIQCDQKAIQDADQLIQSTIARIKTEILTGMDGHGADKSKGQPILDQAQAAFVQLRSSTADVAGIADGGTGSDREVARQEASWQLTIARLKSLEASLGT